MLEPSIGKYERHCGRGRRERRLFGRHDHKNATEEED